MIGIVGGGLAAAKLVEGYREAGGDDEITIWSQDPHGPYHRPPLSKRILRGEAEARDALAHPVEWYAENGVDLRLGEMIASLDDVRAETIVLATGARPRPLPGATTFRTIDDSLALRERAESAEDGRRDRRQLHRLRDHRLADLPRRAGDPDRARPDAVRLAAGAAALRGAASPLPRAGRRPAPRDVGDPCRRADGRRHRRRPERRAGARTPASRCAAGSSSTSGSRPPGPGVYAIGDVAEFYDPVFGRSRRIEHWSNAAYHGTTLGRILAGTRRPLRHRLGVLLRGVRPQLQVLRRRPGARLDVARRRLRRGAGDLPLPARRGRHRRRARRPGRGRRRPR